MAHFLISFATVVSAGPVGNLRMRSPPAPGREYPNAFWYYLAQTFSLIPFLALLFSPVLICLISIVFRIKSWYFEEPKISRFSDLIYILMLVVAADFQLSYLQMFAAAEPCFAYVNPFKCPVMAYRASRERARRTR